MSGGGNVGRILFPEQLEQSNLPRAGGKARGLWLLRRLGHPVPSFFVVPSTVLRDAADGDAEMSGLLGRFRLAARAGDSVTRAELARRLAARARELPFPPGFDDELNQAAGRLGEATPGNGVSVRSSAELEDRPGRSFAGQFRSVLFVRGAARLASAVRDCWASAFNEGVLAYLGADAVDSPPMAVVVQQMVAGEVSGVAFSVDPVSEDPGTLVITAGYGTCDGIVGDRVGTDQLLVHRASRRLERRTGCKTLRMGPAPADGLAAEPTGEGTVAEPVDPALSEAPALDDARALELARMVEEVEARFGLPVDVEWTLAGGRLHLLQARPITTLRRKDPRAQPRLLWDNSNIVESYSGVTSPLTFTFASSAYAVIYRQFGKLVGDSEAFLEAHRRELANMLGLHGGRVYYNLLNWYLAVYYLPGFRFNKGAMEAMMGVKESLDFKVPMGPMTLPEKALETVKVVYMLGRILWNTVCVDRRVRDFHENFERVYGEAAGHDLGRMQVPELLELGERARGGLILRWTAPILTDCLAMVSMKLLKNAVRDWVGGERPGLENDLLAGEGGMDSTRPTKALVAIAARLRADAAALELFASGDQAAIRAAVASEARFEPVRRDIEQFRREFGFRCIGELKLEQDSIKEDPSFVYSMLQNYARQPELDLARMEARERARREEAERYVAGHLLPHPRLGLGVRRFLFDRVLAAARKHVKNRENMRFARTRIFGFFRELYNAAGEKLFAAGLLDHPKDVFYLTTDELAAFAEGRSVTQDVRALTRLRYAEFQELRRQQLPDRFSTHGLAYLPSNQRADPAPEVPADADVAGDPAAEAGGRRLTGVSCCPGVVQGKVRVIRDAQDDLRLSGEILAAPRTDPGWVPLFPSASGLLIESGSVLSHSAIVARELGIPAIVGIRGLMAHVADGQEVRMDAGAGVVELEPGAQPGGPQ